MSKVRKIGLVLLALVLVAGAVAAGLVLAEMYGVSNEYRLVVSISAALIALGIIGIVFLVWSLFSRKSGNGRRDNRTSGRTSAEDKRLALEDAVSGLRNQTEELREGRMWTEWLETMPDPDAGVTPVEDRLRVAIELRQRLYEIQQESEENRRAVSRLSDDRQRAGYRADVLREAAHLAPASALGWIRYAVEDLERQRNENRGSQNDLLGEIEEARHLCNREIANAVARRLPLQLLSVAENALNRAVTPEEVHARQEVVREILDAIYSQYFPGVRGRQRP